ncbi:MAG TPA: MBL fold metallo-hydrolase [Solirubrobacteraceae bacterium]|jgi:L-ascorbate metabolism protein UlaG (beta-lactamase superfamily)
MRIRWLGWAGVEVEAQGERVVVDPLQDASAVFAWLGDRAQTIPLPEVVPPEPGALAGLLTHLHRDHADAGALSTALAAGAPVYEPVDYGGEGRERLAVLQADGELAAAGLPRQPSAAWMSTRAGAFTLTALPAVDGTGDPQVSWLLEADDKRVLHLGDTTWHGWWWRIAERYGPPDVVLAPINGARLTFPHRQPASSLPGAMEPEQAALATELLRANRLVPIHFGAYHLPGVYEPVGDALDRVTVASDRVTPLRPGETIEV